MNSLKQRKQAKEDKEFTQFLKSVSKEVAKWPEWKRQQSQYLFEDSFELENTKCRCGYADCNNRGY